MNIRDGYSYDDLMLIPQHGVLETRKNADISSELVDGWPLLVPIISANMPSVTETKMANIMAFSGGVGAIHRFNTVEEQFTLCKQTSGNVIAAIGLKDGLVRTSTLRDARVKIFLLDVAHADTDVVFDFVEKWKGAWPDLYLIVGNVANKEAIVPLANLGADAIKVGIGPGAACTTREVTGFGYPQLSAVYECAQEKPYCDNHVKIIADGGIRNSGDIVKALAVGADSVMIGSLLAHCSESPNPGEYWGNASQRMNGHNAPEGVSTTIQLAPESAIDVMKRLSWGIRSGISYAGARNIQELRDNAEWVRVTPGTLQESRARI
jgi:IMP dehydrogenase